MIYHEYLQKGLNPQALDAERAKQLHRIGELRGSHVLTYAARMGTLPIRLPIGIDYEDLLPFGDMLDGMTGEKITVILETPGGIGEVGREMVENLHEKFKHITFIVAGCAKSTGTIMAMGGHEIMMWSGSSLGPIDAQIIQDGKQYSADALIEGLEKIKDEVAKTGKLNPAYIPILQRISPGEIQNAHNALEFARNTVAHWLSKYKFSDWNQHQKSGAAVTAKEKLERGYEISKALSSQSRWFTHGRSLRIKDLKELKLKVEALEDNPDLLDAVRRYQVLLRMTFDSGNVYKIFETPERKITRQFNVAPPTAQQLNDLVGQQQNFAAHFEVLCTKCHRKTLIQLDFSKPSPLAAGAVRYPNSGTLSCPQCSTLINLQQFRSMVEKQVGRPALSPQPEV